MQECIYKSKNGCVVKYKHQKAPSDRAHLVVIFAGIGSTYAFQNVAKAFKCDVLWIKDDYNGSVCFYMGKNGVLDFSEAVNFLIEDKISQLGLIKKQCTLLGGSKGAFASLFFGIKYGYTNIIASAYVSKIASSPLWPEITAFFMHDSESKKEQEYYDSLLEKEIVQDRDFNKNIYLILWRGDKYYSSDQEPLLRFFSKYSNLNIVNSESDFVYDHPRVTAYNVPLIIALVNSLIEGIIPNFGHMTNGFVRDVDFDITSDLQKRALGILDKYEFKQRKLYLHGCAFIKGQDCSDGTLYSKNLILSCVNRTEKVKFSLDFFSRKDYSLRFYENYFIDYKDAGFSASGKKALILSNIESGTYDLNIQIKSFDNDQLEENTPLISEKKIDIKYQSQGYEYRLWSYGEGLRLSKRYLFAVSENDIKFEVKKIVFIESGIFHIEGVFIVPGIEVIDWADVKYYLVFHQEDIVKHTYDLGTSHKPGLNNEVDACFGVYQKSYFATKKYKGVSLKNILNGVYDISIILSYKGALFKQIVGNKLKVDADNFFII